jgi:hypothetical protein
VFLLPNKELSVFTVPNEEEKEEMGILKKEKRLPKGRQMGEDSEEREKEKKREETKNNILTCIITTGHFLT